MENAKPCHSVTVLLAPQRVRFVERIYRKLGRKNANFLGLGSSYFTHAAVFELVVRKHVASAQHWLAEATGCLLEELFRENNTAGDDYLRAVFRVGICKDAQQLARINKVYVATPEAIRGGRGTGGITPDNDAHYWHFANVMSLYFNQSDELSTGMEELTSLPPRKQWKHSDDWWRAMVALAVECFTASEPDPWSELAAVAEINQHMFKRDYLNNIYEAWLAEMAMSFIVAARDRGYTIPEKGPHPSTPFGLFHLPPRRIIVRPYDYPHDIDDELKAAITKAWKATRKKKRRRRKKAPK